MARESFIYIGSETDTFAEWFRLFGLYKKYV